MRACLKAGKNIAFFWFIGMVGFLFFSILRKQKFTAGATVGIKPR
jgi:hypothetical protein